MTRLIPPAGSGSRPLAQSAWVDMDGPGQLVVMAVGSTEQHGPHLPLTVDTDVAAAVADAVAAAEGARCAPALPYGASGEHEGFPGTVSIGTEALRAVLVEMGRSACRWAERVVFVNGHGGNVEALGAAGTLLRAEGRDVAWLSCSAPQAHGDAHAGLTETQLMLHLRPAVVRVDRAAPGNSTPLPALLADLRRRGVRAVSPNGVLGDPSRATAAAGAELFAAICDDALGRVRRWRPDRSGRLAAGVTA